MPPVMPHADSRERCRKGWELRRRGRTWEEIAAELGWRSRAAACKAVNTWLAKNPPDDLETMRRATGDTLVEVIEKMITTLDCAIAAGKTRDAAELGKVVLDGLDKHAKLTGQHVMVATEVNVTVHAAEILTDARKRLMEAVDAEFVELPVDVVAIER